MSLNGSGNWSSAGTSKNYENFVRLGDATMVEGFVAFFARAFALANPREACACDTSSPACRERFCLDRAF